MAGNSEPGLAHPFAAPADAAPLARVPVLRVLPGTPEAVGVARELARELLGSNHPAADTVLLLVSELVTNSIRHSRSGAPGGTVTITLCPGSAGVLVQVRDDGGPSVPSVSAAPGGNAEHGYGLLLVDALADSWGTLASAEGRVTWCRVSSTSGDATARAAT